MQDTRPNDLVTQREAAKMIGRTIDTVRRWRREHGLRVFRDPDSPVAPAQISKVELLALAQRLSGEYKGRVTPQNEQTIENYTALEVQQAHIRDLQAQIADLQQARAEMTQLIDLLMDETKRLRSDLDERNQKVAVLEHELTGGLVRGLLTGARRRLGL